MFHSDSPSPPILTSNEGFEKLKQLQPKFSKETQLFENIEKYITKTGSKATEEEKGQITESQDTEPPITVHDNFIEVEPTVPTNTLNSDSDEETELSRAEKLLEFRRRFELYIQQLDDDSYGISEESIKSLLDRNSAEWRGMFQTVMKDGFSNEFVDAFCDGLDDSARRQLLRNMCINNNEGDGLLTIDEDESSCDTDSQLTPYTRHSCDRNRRFIVYSDAKSQTSLTGNEFSLLDVDGEIVETDNSEQEVQEHLEISELQENDGSNGVQDNEMLQLQNMENEIIGDSLALESTSAAERRLAFARTEVFHSEIGGTPARVRFLDHFFPVYGKLVVVLFCIILACFIAYIFLPDRELPPTTPPPTKSLLDWVKSVF